MTLIYCSQVFVVDLLLKVSVCQGNEYVGCGLDNHLCL